MGVGRLGPVASPLVRNRRLRAEDWVAAGLDVLVESGAAAVKVLPLANGLGVTTGSFYWHFKNRDALSEALLDAWEATNTRAIVDAVATPGTVVDKFIALSREWLGWSDFDPELDLAVRDWGRRDPAVLKRLKAADERRVAAFVEMMQPEGHGPTMTLHRARTMYYLQMGWYELGVDDPTAARAESAVAYFEIFLGRPPTPVERDAMAARIAPGTAQPKRQRTPPR